MVDKTNTADDYIVGFNCRSVTADLAKLLPVEPTVNDYNGANDRMSKTGKRNPALSQPTS